uniref:AMP-binding enzyme C-terminal domain-containing protein n=1 Tax=Phenylobacterium glaciei TaxID=2803784 RepID=A0A974SBS5_9CAUL|nr:hypothetical protein JKL49_00610 [Phenylobacterium glaciei]
MIGIPDDDLGAKIHAIVQTRGVGDETALREHLKTKLVTYKQPRTYEFVDEPLRDDAGKVRRTAPRRPHRQAEGRPAGLTLSPLLPAGVEEETALPLPARRAKPTAIH